MAHVFRFFGRPTDSTASVWKIESQEHQHLSRTLRLSVGDEVEVADGNGLWGVGVVSESSKSETFVRVSDLKKEAPPSPQIFLVVGYLKPQNIDELLADVVEVGADRIIAFRSEAAKRDQIKTATLERWRRLARASTKQCKRAYLPTVDAFDDLTSALDVVQWNSATTYRALADVSGPRNVTNEKSQFEKVVILVGGEGGFSKTEMDIATQQPAHKVSLGRYVLRSTTAAVAAVSWLLTEFG